MEKRHTFLGKSYFIFTSKKNTVLEPVAKLGEKESNTSQGQEGTITISAKGFWGVGGSQSAPGACCLQMQLLLSTSEGDSMAVHVCKYNWRNLPCILIL